MVKSQKNDCSPQMLYKSDEIIKQYEYTLNNSLHQFKIHSRNLCRNFHNDY